jgi:hypothetical protein
VGRPGPPSVGLRSPSRRRVRVKARGPPWTGGADTDIDPPMRRLDRVPAACRDLAALGVDVEERHELGPVFPMSRTVAGSAGEQALKLVEQLPGKTLIEINGARSTGLIVVGWKDGAADEADRRGAFGWLGLLSV